ncbi:MAG: class I SAM-dependent methyltransferase [Gemmataceae bacterium]|nr:class I SAM-dependent methyltransferase [Gemmataceae bacterium]
MTAMLPRTLETELMDTPEEAQGYDAMDHSAVNRAFAADFLALYRGIGPVLDVGTGTAQIPIEMVRQRESLGVVAVDAAEHMIALAEANVQRAGMAGRVVPRLANARRLPWAMGHFPAVASNSIVHHIPEPGPVLAEMARVLAPGGLLFVRDLLRPDSAAEAERLVSLHAAGATTHQRQMFRDSLHAALTVDEVRALVAPLGFADAVRRTSDRHWTLAGRR